MRSVFFAPKRSPTHVGEFPTLVSASPGLLFLDLTDNALSGDPNLQSDISVLANLTTLRLSGNNLSSPAHLLNLPNSTQEFRYDGLTGGRSTLPTFPSMRILDLSHPAANSAIEANRSIYLSSGNLFFSGPNLVYVNVSNNPLCVCTLPRPLHHSTRLTRRRCRRVCWFMQWLND